MKYLLLLLTLFASQNLFAQADNTAPVVWEHYRHTDMEVSIDLPKMPMVIESYDTCKEELKRSSFAYAEGVVYEFTVVAINIRRGVKPRTCPPEKFDLEKSTFFQRAAQLRQGKGVIESDARIADNGAFYFKDETSIHALIPNIGYKVWIELGIVHYPNEQPNIDRFFESLRFGTSSGKEIGEGAKVMLGDPMVQAVSSEPTAAPAASAKPATPPASGEVAAPGSGPGVAKTIPDQITEPLQILAKPQARYTEMARKKNVQGSVRLKATLLANGSVGAVTAVTTLEEGLTEQAIAAARRIVFLPARVNHVAVPKDITIDYSFSVY